MLMPLRWDLFLVWARALALNGPDHVKISVTLLAVSYLKAPAPTSIQEWLPTHSCCPAHDNRCYDTAARRDACHCKFALPLCLPFTSVALQPINSSPTMQNCLDIVATQGVYLVNRVGTPVDENSPDNEFAAKLFRKLNAILIAQTCREVKYGKTADEWPIGHTPPAGKEKRRAELRTLEEHEGGISDDDSDGHNDGGGIEGKTNWGKGPARSHQEQWLPTPPLSIDITVCKPHGKKRRHSDADEGEDVGSTKILSVDSIVPLQGKGAKRRRVSDDYEDQEEKRPDKFRTTITTTRTNRRLRAAGLTVQLGG